MNKDIYINDLKHRFPGYSFTETPKGDLVTVAFLDDQQIEQAAATNESLMDAYRTIRRSMLEGEDPVFLSSTSERNKLNDVIEGIIIYNTNKRRNESFGNAKWENSAGPGMMTDVAYGEMYQDINFGTAIPNIGQKRGIWTSAQLGNLDKNGIVTFDRPRLIIGEGGGWGLCGLVQS